MEEPVKVLSATKKRKSLGEMTVQENKKKCARSRTTVLNPREIDWPTDLTESKKEELLAKIKSLAKALHNPIRKIPLEKIRKIPKADRPEFRVKWMMDESKRLHAQSQSYSLLRSSIAIGINCVSRALDLNQLVAVIVEKNVNPPLLTKLLVPLANAKEVPIIACDFLNSAFKEGCNWRCIAIGLKRTCAQISHTCHPLLQLIRKLDRDQDLASEEYSGGVSSVIDNRGDETGKPCLNIPVEAEEVLGHSESEQLSPLPTSAEETRESLKRKTKTPTYIPPKVRKQEPDKE